MRFFFDYKAERDTIYDFKGEDFRDDQSALEFAEATVHHLKASLKGDWNTYAVEVRDAEGKKYFSLPITPCDSSIQLIDRRSHQPGTRRVRLLIIEDTDVHAAVIGRSAAKQGFAVTNAPSYENACDILSTEEFDCITLDLGLGDHVGFEILRYLASIHSRTQIIVISATSQETRDDVVELGRALGLRVYASMPKPIDLSALTEMLTHIESHLAHQKETNTVEEAGKHRTSAAVH
jgi:CheY-like chemotaxis protein